ncbi:DNA-directed RNA polymerase subunit beta [Neisseria meningitidis]|nr:DNA-directed RNA polymerase subunit beta [Neisseria meningitidis]MBG8921879.1 DNA-directed RNA polymerase subunit beta [Neisseria meningitidis]MBG8977711.1 DNA-directed RNA polymerase subunit beta [Neisseria meningitidis]ODP43169.1 DNA-directed RNA polymerase subunit beta [Neisseria meningitidis]ODP43300.1 DNA-directed RNA polymerase subunit beta [Neisseria meningitidis]
MAVLLSTNTQSAATAGVANPNANTAKHNIFFMSDPLVLVNKIKLNCKKNDFFQEKNIPSCYLTTVSDGIVSICTPPL